MEEGGSEGLGYSRIRSFRIRRLVRLVEGEVDSWVWRKKYLFFCV